METPKAKRIKLLFLDVDGVLTDGRIWMGPQGEMLKAFYVKDGLGIKMLEMAGIQVVLVTGRSSEALSIRAQELGVELYQGVDDKESLCNSIVRQKGLKVEEVCGMGDDLQDMGIFKVSGLKVAVGDAVKEIKEAADIVAESNGGQGAVRELCEIILKSQGKWEEVLSKSMGKTPLH